MMTTDSDRRLLLRIAREAITAHVQGTRPAPADAAAILQQPGAVFVSIHRNHQLRGCIGHLAQDDPLGIVVPACAVAASSADPRFPAVTAVELPAIDIELSLLGPLEPIAGPEGIDVGSHGIVVEDGWHRGLLLPQVAAERGWDREQFLARTCHKAGLSADAWKRGAKLWRFEAEVFGETR
jgi:AmmeMemoRadiSam system protein A